MAEILRQEDHYVLLMPGCPEEFVTAAQLVEFLAQMLGEYPEVIDTDLQRYDSDRARAERLIQTACELQIAPGETVEWYAVRLDKHRA
jgi:hypothetical protein